MNNFLTVLIVNTTIFKYNALFFDVANIFLYTYTAFLKASSEA